MAKYRKKPVVIEAVKTLETINNIGKKCGLLDTEIDQYGKYKAKIGNKFTLAYKYWCSMMERGYSYDFKNKHKNYINVYVCEEWHNFQNFAEWFYKNYYEVNEERMLLTFLPLNLADTSSA